MSVVHIARRGRRFSREHVPGHLFAPICDDDPSFPWRPIAVLVLGIVVVVATVIALTFLVAWPVTGRAY
jgi:hypothetical protein